MAVARSRRQHVIELMAAMVLNLASSNGGLLHLSGNQHGHMMHALMDIHTWTAI